MDRMITTLIAAAMIVTAFPAAAEQRDAAVEPYRAYIIVDGAYVRSGPSVDYYRTDPMEFGEELEVYLETSDGWLGVRPPESSFSWLPAVQVEFEETDSLARVVAPKTVAWIGTNLGKAKKFRWQVQLAEGEQVVVLDRITRTGADGEKQVWLQIVPPSGEFRWIERNKVALTEEDLERHVAERERRKRERVARGRDRKVSQADHMQETETSPAEWDGSGDPPPAPVVVSSRGARKMDGDFASSEANPLRTNSDQVSDTPVGSGVAQADYQSDAGTNESDDDGNWQRVGSVNQIGGSDRRPAQSKPVGAADRDPSHAAAGSSWELEQPVSGLSVDELQVLFSQAVAGKATSDALRPLADRVEELSDLGEDKLIRARATILLERIDRYREISSDREFRPPPVATVRTLEPVTRSQFDREGFLVQVYSARPNAPPFALTNRSGETIAYISPSPGINLRRYLNEKVGILGRTGYLTGLDTPHLIVERVTRIQD